MTRGRKKDLTIPPTRALVQQRDYRARKAHYIADLEERVQRVEAENAQLRKDLEAARAGLSAPATPLSRQIVGDAFLDPNTEASRDLMHHLSLATDSLNRFYYLTSSDKPYLLNLPPLQLPQTDISTQGRPASFPSPTPSPLFSQPGLLPTPSIVPVSIASTVSHPSSTDRISGRKRLYREESLEPNSPPHLIENVLPRSDSSSESLSPELELGIPDCRDVIEGNRDKEDRDSHSRGLPSIRSTSGPSYARQDHFRHPY